MTVKDLIQQDIDIDVYDDVCEDLAIAFCGPCELTEEGQKEFAEVMDYEIELNRALCFMGMPTAFSRDADFSNMYYDDAGKDVYIGYVLHKTFIDLDENGTKAAAATIVVMQEKGMPMKPDKEVVFDRPFVYCIFDTQTNILLFIGALNSLS